jgi:hypothetical protein
MQYGREIGGLQHPKIKIQGSITERQRPADTDATLPFYRKHVQTNMPALKLFLLVSEYLFPF